MSRSLLLLLGAAVFCDSPRTFAAATNDSIWQLGLDDRRTSPFGSERNGATPAPGSATSRDDDYYFAGTYGDPVGTLETHEAEGNFERALTAYDPRNRIHFPLEPVYRTDESRLTLTVDLYNAGSWTGSTQPGYGTHDFTIRLNGQTIASRTGFTYDDRIVAVFPASSVALRAEDNVIEIERSGGSEGGYVSIDFVRLEADPDALRDADGDGLPLWFEELYGLSDSDGTDATGDRDGDGLSALGEFEAGTNPTDPDSDNDGISDRDETDTDPLLPDTDGDGISDGDETASDPLLSDTDSDSYPDNVEIERGSDPRSASSTPFGFSGVIGLQFVSERRDSLPLQDLDPAGLFRFPNWNTTAGQPQWYVSDEPLSGSMSGLRNCRNAVTSLNADWTFRYSPTGYHQGRSDERLFAGMIGADTTPTGKVPVTLNLTGIPFAGYDLIAYVGDQYPSSRGTVELGGNAGSRRYFISDTSPPFLGWNEITATDEDDIREGNYVRYRNLSGASQTLIVSQLDNDRISLHGIQIIDTSSDSDGDLMPDANEIEHGLNPALADAGEDPDGDGLDNAAELAAGTDPFNRDSDFDGLADGSEAAHGADPLDPDSDDDGLTDGDEISGEPFPSLADNPNSDGDSHNDREEREAGTDPMDAASFPLPTPTYHIGSRTWTWRLDNVRVRWNHGQSMLGALNRNDVMLFDFITVLNDPDVPDDGGWRSNLSMGIFYDEGRLYHRFRCNSDVFHREGNTSSSHYSGGSSDITRALGFSGFGNDDVSHPLRFEFTASRPTQFGNSWAIGFTLSDVRDPANPVVIATATWTNSSSIHSGMMNGTAPWADTSGTPEKITHDIEPGVAVFVSGREIGPEDGDSDGMPDAWETQYAFDIADPADAPLDADSDSLSNLREFLAGTDPRNPDSDGDGATDGTEVAHGTSPTVAESHPVWIDFTGNADDLDGDGLSDAWTLWSGGRKRVALADDDGDGMTNLEESEAGTDPDDPESRLKIGLTPVGNHLLVEWSDLPLKSQLLERSDLVSPWEPLSGAPPAVVARGMRKVTLLDELTDPSGGNFFRTSVGPMDTDLDGVEDWVEENILGSSPEGGDSLGQPLVLSDSSTLSGDARALLDRLRSGSGEPSNPTSGDRPSRVHASRFLMQATFGPTPADIDRVVGSGYGAWIEDQLALPPSRLKPYILRIKDDAANGRHDHSYDFNEGSSYVTGRNFTTPWARNAVSAPDQLRQRVAFALSQILVISRRDDRLSEKPEAMADYYDMLIDHAFGNYGDLLLDVSLHPAMGWYLTSVGNQKADPSIPRYPDENYAREIMQLFSIGLWELNPDGTRRLDPGGEPIPTYDTSDITELARVFTGLYYDAPYGWGGGGWEESHFLKPMVMFDEYHDFEPKNLLNGFVIPAREPGSGAGMQDVRDAVDNLVRHPNTAPYVSTRLIRFLVTDNPSPAYVGRVSAVFTDDGTGRRGNLGAVVRAILMDPEARTHPTDDGYGKVREPVIRTMHLGRLFNLARAHPEFVWWNSESTYYNYSFQEPLYAPSVFNFYTPEYQAPGDIRDRGLVSPGFQIIDTYSAISFPNRLWDYLYEGFISSWNGPRYPLDYSDSLLVADDPEALIDHIDLLVCTGNMTARTRSILRSSLSDPDLTPKDRLAVAVWTAINSPEGVIQR